MAEGKNSILIYTDWIDTFESLSDEEAGRLVKHLFRYVNDKNPIAPDRLTEISFIPIKNSLKRDLKKWELELERKSDGGRLGNLKRWNLDLYELVLKKEITLEKAEEIGKGRIKSHTDTQRKNESLPIASIADSVLVPVTVPVSVKEKKNKGVFTPPSFIDFEIYCKENGFQNIAERAFKGYSENDWKDSKNNPVLNWKSKLQNVWFNEKNRDKQETSKIIKCIRQDHMGRMEVELTMGKIEQLRANGTIITIL